MSDFRVPVHFPSHFNDSNESTLPVVGRARSTSTVVASERLPSGRPPTAEGMQGGGPLRRSNSLSSFTSQSSLDSAAAFCAGPEVRKALARLDARYGTVNPPNPRDKKSGIHPSELNRLDPTCVLVNPQRIVFSPYHADRAQIDQLKILLDKVTAGELPKCKWIVSRSGSLVIGPSVMTEMEGEHDELTSQIRPRRKLGHPTLIGGLPLPEGRVSGEVLFKPLTAGGESVLHINNASGRYGTYGNCTPQHLANAAKRFADLGLPVEHQWIDLEEKPKQVKS